MGTNHNNIQEEEEEEEEEECGSDIDNGRQ
jgi:hypothetical protein